MVHACPLANGTSLGYQGRRGRANSARIRWFHHGNISTKGLKREDEWDGGGKGVRHCREVHQGDVGLERLARRKRDKQKWPHVERKGKEHIDAELLLLFGFVGLILVVPWIVSDPRAVWCVVVGVLMVPGVSATVIHGAGEVAASLLGSWMRKKKGNNSDYSDSSANSGNKISRDDNSGTNKEGRSKGYGGRCRKQVNSDRSIMTVSEQEKVNMHSINSSPLAKLPFFRHWGGFL